LANPARGINWEACLAKGRRGWGTRRLQAFHYFIREDDAALMQEVGHHWGAYAGFKTSPGDRQVRFDYCLGNEPGHWSSYFDDDRSPMDYDESELSLPIGVSADWVENGDGTFTRRPVRQGGYAFCNLDLYLMGLIPPGPASTPLHSERHLGQWRAAAFGRPLRQAIPPGLRPAHDGRHRGAEPSAAPGRTPPAI